MKLTGVQGKKILIAGILIGLICSIFLGVQRNRIEVNSNVIEMAMDYDAVISMVKLDEPNIAVALDKFHQAGITSFAVYDTTLKKLVDRGELSVVTKKGLDMYFKGLTSGVQTYDVYVIGKERTLQDSVFDEVYQDLVLRLGADKVGIIENGQYHLIGIHGDLATLMDLNLGILSSDANQIAAYGFNTILRPTNYSHTTVVEVNHFFDRADTISNVSGIMFVGKEVLGYKDQVALTAEQMAQRQWPFYMIEAQSQLQYDPQEGMFDLVDKLHYNVVRTYAMSKEELWKITPEEAAQRYFISDIERNARVNLFPLYKKSVDNLTLTETNLKYISDTAQQLQERGYTLGRASVMPPYFPSKILIFIAAIGALCGFIFALNLYVSLADKWNYLLLLVGVVGSAGAFVFTNGTLYQQILALGCACLAPVVAMILLMDCWKKKVIPHKLPFRLVILDGTKYLIGAFLLSLMGGLYVAALLGNIRFLMELDIYRGVKLTFLVPLVLITIAYLQRFPLIGKPIRSTTEFMTFIKEVLNIPIKLSSLLVVSLLAVGGIVFIGRSGHTEGIPVPAIEVSLRRFLENVLYARPREKEFVIGHPAFYLSLAALYRRWPQFLHYFLIVGATIGQGSMVETFAHIRTPIFMSLVRGIDGLACGIFFGICAIVGIVMIEYISAWLGKRVEADE